MDWLPTMLDAIFVLGQVSACVGLAYGACLSIRYARLLSISDSSAASTRIFTRQELSAARCFR
jgi:hypothetical protein